MSRSNNILNNQWLKTRKGKQETKHTIYKYSSESPILSELYRSSDCEQGHCNRGRERGCHLKYYIDTCNWKCKTSSIILLIWMWGKVKNYIHHLKVTQPAQFRWESALEALPFQTSVCLVFRKKVKHQQLDYMY
jgi:hypothetical protein